MMRSVFLRYPIAILVSIMTMAASHVFAADRATRPNVIVFLTDDQGYADAGVYGSEDIDTPNIDQLANEGIRFTSFYAQPLCGPSRAALLTGRYPIRIAEPEGAKHPNTTLAASEVTFAELLQQSGYATALIGKWHLAGDGAPWDYAPPPMPPGRPGGKGPFDEALMPNAQGFDYFFGTPMHNGYTQKVDPRRFIVDLMRDGQVVESETDVNQLTARYTDEALRFIRGNAARPFLLLLSHNMPHVSLGVSPNFAGRSRRGLYGDVIAELDWSLGQVLAELRTQGIDENTLVIFLSDNGPPLGQLSDRNGASAVPLRGGKYSNWEGGVRVPAIMRWTNSIPASQVDHQIASVMDLLPTIAGVSDVEIPLDLEIDGKNLMPRLMGKSMIEDQPHFYYSLTSLQAVRQGAWKLVLPREKNAPELSWLGRYTEDIAEHQLYNLNKDIGETFNIADQHPDVVERLIQHALWAKQNLKPDMPLKP